ncbi:cytochrome oxidase Cu insertion factor (SCO1/SenC/PrrC family) [Pedobacter sp. UYP30]|uniref:TlpA family protein disulfide reductase n=1 Tax=Pedobacter sp. UYP30 TaxID=1756400 RepID=UPI00339434F5
MKLKIAILFVACFTFNQLKAQQPTFLPQFKFYALDGKQFTNNNLSQTKPNLFMFFDCTCEHCQHEAMLMTANFKKLSKVNIVMVTLDEQSAIKQFFTRYAPGLNAKTNVTVVQDKNGIFIPTFLPSIYPAFYLYTPKGKLISYEKGDGAMKRLLTKVGK